MGKYILLPCDNEESLQKRGIRRYQLISSKDVLGDAPQTLFLHAGFNSFDATYDRISDKSLMAGLVMRLNRSKIKRNSKGYITDGIDVIPLNFDLAILDLLNRHYSFKYEKFYQKLNII